MDEVRTLIAGPGPIVPEGADPYPDESRIGGHDGVPVDSCAAEIARRGGLEEDIGRAQQVRQLLPARFFGEVGCQAPLPEVVVPEMEAAVRVRLVVEEGTDRAGTIPTWRLHLDDVGAEARQHLARVLTLFVGQFDDADAVQVAVSFTGAWGHCC